MSRTKRPTRTPPSPSPFEWKLSLHPSGAAYTLFIPRTSEVHPRAYMTICYWFRTCVIAPSEAYYAIHSRSEEELLSSYVTMKAATKSHYLKRTYVLIENQYGTHVVQ